MPSCKLTASFVSRVPLAESGQQWFWDSRTAGFGLQVGTTARSYVVQCRGKRATLGRVSDLTLEEAREKAIAFIQAVRHGQDPRTERAVAHSKSERLAALTLRAAMDECFAAKAQFTKALTLIDYRRLIEAYLVEWLDKPLATIKRSDVTSRFAEICEGRNLGQRKDNGKYAKTATLSGGRVPALKSMTAFRIVYNFARFQHEDLGLAECPVAVLGHTSRGWSRLEPRDRVISDVARFIAAARSYESPIQQDLVLFILGTGLRKNEATRLRWDEVDLDEGTIKLDGSRMKAGRSLYIPITRIALECLQRRAAKGQDSSGYVFVGRREARGQLREGFATVSKAMLKHLTERTGEVTSPHDWRRTFSTIALSAGVPLQVVEWLTAHKSPGVTLQHYYNPSREDLRTEIRKLDALLDVASVPPESAAGHSTRTASAASSVCP